MTHTTPRQRAIDGILRRWRSSQLSTDWILRGGLVTAHWIWPHPRTSDDVDFLSITPQADEEQRALLLQLIALEANDGLSYSAPHGVETIWEETATPGLRVICQVSVDGEAQEQPLQLDVGYGDPMPLPAALVSWPRTTAAPSTLDLAPLPIVRPEVLVAWKLHGLFEFDSKRWRCKDLHDIYLLQTHATLDEAAIPACIATAFKSRRDPLSKTDRLTSGDFGQSRGSRREWEKFRRAHPERDAPADHLEVITKVSDFLKPLLAQAKHIEAETSG